MTTVITSVGYPGAGKSELAEVVEDRGIHAISMGNVLRDRFDKADKNGDVAEQIDNYNDKNKSTVLGEWATMQREVHGNDIVAQWTTEYIERNLEDDTVFVDGLRSVDELEVFQTNFHNVFVIYVEAERDTRLERLQNRGRDGEEKFTIEDLEQRDKREDDWGLNHIKQHTDYSITNEGTLEEFHDSIIDVIEDLE